MSDVEIRSLSERELFGDFRSGNASLDAFLRRYAKQSQFKLGISTTHLALFEGRIAGYVTITTATLEPARIDEMVKHLPRYQVPALLVARMATNERFQGKGFGARLMREVVFREAIHQRERTGCVGVLVDPKPNAVSFYERLGFQPIRAATRAGDPADAQTAETPAPMFLPLGTVRQKSKAP